MAEKLFVGVMVLVSEDFCFLTTRTTAFLATNFFGFLYAGAFGAFLGFKESFGEKLAGEVAVGFAGASFLAGDDCGGGEML